MIKIKPNETKLFKLAFGIEMSDGVVFVSLKQQLGYQRCIIKNETICESVSDIVIGIQNISNKEVVIVPGQELCFLHYLN